MSLATRRARARIVRLIHTGVVVAAVLLACGTRADPLVPFPGPLPAPSSGGGGGGGSGVSGSCATANGIAYFSASTTLTCNAGITTDGSGALLVQDGSAANTAYGFQTDATAGLYIGVTGAAGSGFPAVAVAGGTQDEIDLVAHFVQMGSSDDGTAAVAVSGGFGMLGANSSVYMQETTSATGGAAAKFAGYAGLYSDSTLHRLQLSNNNGAYSTVVTAGESQTFTSTAWTFSNDMAVTLSGGVNGINFDSNTLSIDATNNRVGIGTAAPSHTLDVDGGTITTTRAVSGGATASAAATAPVTAVSFGLTSAGSNASATQTGLAGSVTGTYSGTAATYGVSGFNSTPGTGTRVFSSSSSYNMGVRGAAVQSTSAGTNIGVVGHGIFGTGINIGVLGEAFKGVTNPSATRIGVVGNATSNSTMVGGYFSLVTDDAVNPTFTSAALIADNADKSVPIAIFRDNGSTTIGWSFANGGDLDPLSDNAVAIGDSTHRASEVNAVVVNTGDLVMRSPHDGGKTAAWRLIERSDGIEACNENTGRCFDLNMIDNGRMLESRTEDR